MPFLAPDAAKMAQNTKKGPPDLLSYAWQQNTQSITILWVKESLVQTNSAVLQILQNHHIFYSCTNTLQSKTMVFTILFCCCNQILFIFGNFCFTIILYLDKHKSFFERILSDGSVFFSGSGIKITLFNRIIQSISKYRTYICYMHIIQ